METWLKAIGLDADGVVINTKHPELAFFNTILKEEKLPILTAEEFDTVKKCDSENTVKAYFEYKQPNLSSDDDLDKKIQKLADKRKQLIYDLLDIKLNPIYRGSAEAIRSLYDAGKKIFSVTGLWAEEANKHLEKAGIKKYFADTIAYHNCPQERKPHSRPYEMLRDELQKKGISVEDCLIIEDAPEGVISAKSVFPFVLAVMNTHKDEHEFKRAGADAVIDSLNPSLTKVLLGIQTRPESGAELEKEIISSYENGDWTKTWQGFSTIVRDVIKNEFVYATDVIIGQRTKVKY